MRKIASVLALAVRFVVSCASEPVSVEVTSVVEVPIVITIEVPVDVTRIVTEFVEVKVTVPIEVTKEVIVTSEVEVTREVVVEKIVTATPTSTAEPSPTKESSAGSNPPASSALLQSMRKVRDLLNEMGGIIDGTGSMSAQRIVDIYDTIASSPEYNVTGSSVAVQNAYSSYRSAISIYTTSARDLALHARDFLASDSDGSSIPFQQWGVARQSINDALNHLNPAIDSLE